jgi:hypothetical protein
LGRALGNKPVKTAKDRDESGRKSRIDMERLRFDLAGLDEVLIGV